MKDRELARSFVLEFKRQECVFEEMRCVFEWKQREYLRGLIVSVLQENGYGVPSSEWLDRAVDYYLPYLQDE